MPKEKKENLEFLGCNLMKYDFLKIEKQENNIYPPSANNNLEPIEEFGDFDNFWNREDVFEELTDKEREDTKVSLSL